MPKYVSQEETVQCRRKVMTYHEKWGNDPIYDDAKQYLLPHGSLRQDLVEGLVLDFAQNRIHHDEETNSCRVEISTI